MIEVEIYIKDHCIETESQHKFKVLMDHCFETDCTEEEMRQLEFLRDFLTTADFKTLRSSSPLLSGEVQGSVIVKKQNGTFSIAEFPGIE